MIVVQSLKLEVFHLVSLMSQKACRLCIHTKLTERVLQNLVGILFENHAVLNMTKYDLCNVVLLKPRQSV